jgi:predicted phosphodiesterase
MSDVLTSDPSNIPIDTPTFTPTVIPSPTSTPTISATPTPDVFAAEFPLGDVAYVLPLTIRHITPTRAVLFFELDQAVEGMLFYQVEGAAAGGELPFRADAVRHQLTLDTLVPGTTYKIRVGIPGADGGFSEPHFLGGKWGPLTVHTPSEMNPLRFGVIGDASFGDSVTATLVEQMAAADLEFVLHTGDVVDETEFNADPFESYAHKYYMTFAPLLQQIPIYTVPGNHDYDPDIRWQGEPFYFNAFPPFEDPRIPASGTNQYYAFVMGKMQFIMLDSQVFFGIAGRDDEHTGVSCLTVQQQFRPSQRRTPGTGKLVTLVPGSKYPAGLFRPYASV